MKEKLKKLFNTLKSMWDKPLPGRFLTLKEAGAFGIYALGNSWIYNTMMLVVTVTQIPYFYGVSSLHGYIVYIIGTLLASILTPLAANAMEKKRTKWGRYKPYILFSLPAFALFTMLAMWVPQGYTDAGKIAYVYISCVPLIAIATFSNNMYQTMPNVITPNSQERADIMTPVGLLVGFAPTIMNLIVGPIRSAFIENGQGEFMAMRVLGLIAVVLGTICIMFIIKVKERVYEIETAPDGFEVKTDFSDVPPEGETAPPAAEEAAEGAAPLADDGAREGELTFEGMVAAETPASAEEPFLGNAVPGGETAAAAAAAAPAMPARNKYQGIKDFFSLFKNKPLMILFFALIVGSLREFWVQFRPLILQLRYSADVTVALDIMGVANTVIGFASTVAMLLLPIVTRKLNKNVIIIVFSSLSLVVCGALGFVGIENIPQGTVSAVVLTLLFFIAQCNPTYLLIPVMLGEIADWQQARTGKRYEGHLQNFIFTIPGVFSQVAMLASWLWQNAIGFEPAQISNDISEAVGQIAEGAAIDPTTIVSAETHALANEWFNACFLLTAGSIVLMIILLCFYPLTRKKHAELIAELESKATNLDELDENESVLAEDGSLVLKRTLTEGGESGDEIAEAELPEATPIPETPDEAGGDAPEKLADGAPPEAGSDLPSEDGPETK